MIDVITGYQLGVGSTSGAALNLDSSPGQAQQKIHVNALTGNLTIQRTDQVLFGTGPDTALIRTYNSQGRFDDENGDNFRFSIQRRISNLTGTVNTAGSTVLRTAEDGSQQTFTYRADLACYLSTDGADAHDTLSYSSGTNTWTYTEGSSKQQEHYESTRTGQWRLTRVQDSEGRALTFAYNSSGFVNRISDSSGQTTYIDFSGRNVTQIRTESLGIQQTATRYIYDKFGRLTQAVVDLTPNDNAVTDGNVYTTTYTYSDTSNRIASIAQSDGTSISFTYKLVGADYRVETITRGLGADAVELRFTYRTGATDIVRVNTPGVGATTGPMTTVTYDSAGRLSQTAGPTDFIGRRPTTIYTYDADNNIRTIEEPGSRITRFVYDTSGNLLETWDPSGNLVARRTYSANLLTSETTYPAGAGVATSAQTTNYARDAMGRTRFVIGTDRRVVETRYGDAAGERVVSTISYLDEYAGSTDVAALEAWVSGLDKSRSRRTDTFLDFRGQASRSVRYDEIDAATGEGILTPAASATHYVYDQWGRLLQSIDPRGETESLAEHTTHYLYDGLGRLIQTIDPRSYSTVTSYAGNTVITTYANNLQTQTIYSSAGDVLRETKADATAPGAVLSETRYVYDDLGRLRATIDAAGAITHRLYDAIGRDVGHVDANGLLTETFYNLTGEKLQTRLYSNPAKAVELLELVRQVNSGVFASTDGLWQLARLRPTADINNDRVNDFLYDNVGRLIYSVDADHAVIETRYDAIGQVTETVRYDTPLVFADRRTRLWDPLATGGDPGASTYIRTYLAGVATTASRLSTFIYDVSGRAVAVIDAEGYLTETKYNRFGQLIQTVRYGSRANAFDATGRVINPAMLASRDLAALRPALSDDDLRTYMFYDGKGQTTFEVDVAGHSTAIASTSREVRVREMRYDAAGNLAEKVTYATPRFERGGAYSFDTFAAYLSALDGAQGDVRRLDLTAVRPTQSAEQARLNDILQYRYDGRNQVIRIINGDGTETAYQYNAVGQRTHTTSADGTDESRTTVVDYDVLGRARANTTPLAAAAGARSTQRYDAAGRTVEMTDELGNRLWNYYTAGGLLAYHVDSEGYATGYVYNTFGEVIETVRFANRLTGDLSTLTGGRVDSAFLSRMTSSPNDIHTKQTYTRRGAAYQFQSAEAAARGAASSVVNQYNAFGELIKQQNALDIRTGITEWRETTITYDRRGLVTRTNTAGAVTQAEYDAHGRVRKAVDARDYASFLTYDGFGRTISTTDTGGSRHQATYDAVGRVLTETDANNKVTQYRYDPEARSVTVVTPEGISVTKFQNRHGQTVRVIDGKGQTSLQFEYDGNGNAVRVLDALGAPTVSRYNAANRLYETENALGHRVSYEYDANGRIIRQVTDPTGLALVTTYKWDAFGREIETKDAAGVVRRLQYDKDGRLTRVLIDPTGLGLYTDYAYDLAGRCVRTTQGSLAAGALRESQTTYDALDRVIREVLDPSGLNLATSHTYDANGNRISTTNPAGDTSFTLYDTANRPAFSLTPLRDAGAGAVEFAAIQTRYDAEGRAISTIQYATPVVINDTNRHLTTDLTALRTYVQARATGRDRIVHRLYDSDGRQVYIIDAERSLAKTIYDANGNVVETIAYAKPLSGSVVLSTAAVDAWTANPANRSADDQQHWFVVDANNQRTYEVDALGYVTQVQYDAVGQAVRTVQYANAINPATQAASDVVADEAHDRSTRIVYNAAGLAVYQIDSLNFVIEFKYDALGRVTQTTRYHNAVSVGQTPSLTDVASTLRSHPQDQISRSFYDTAGRRIYALDALSTLTSFSYDALGQAIGERRFYVRYTGAMTLAGVAAHASSTMDRVAATDYDKAGRVVTEYDGARTEPGVPIEQYAYDANGNLLRKTDRRGHLTLYGYDKNGRLLRTVRQRDAGTPGTKLKAYVVDFEYDALGNQITQIQYMNAAVLFYTTSTGATSPYTAMQIVVTPNADSVSGDRVTRYVYNRRGQQTQVQQAISSIITQTDYDAFGRNVRVIEALGSAEEQKGESVYDRRNQIVAVVAAAGRLEASRVEMRYDAFGQVTEEVGANGIALADTDAAWARSWRISHGYFANASALSAADKSDLRKLYTTQFTYDSVGKLATVTQPQWGAELTGRVPASLSTTVTTSLYDGNGNVIRTTDAIGAQRFYYYDQGNRLRAEVDELGFVNRYDYDAGGKLVETRHYATALRAGSYDETRSYDDIAALLRADAQDRLTQHRYDARGRLESTTYAATETLVYQEKFTYDADGNRTSFTNKNGAIFNFEYDALNRMIKEITPSVRIVLSTTSSSTTKSTVRIENVYEYDAVGQRVAEFIADNVDNQRQVRRSIYDKLGREVEQRVEDVLAYDTGASAESLRVATTRRVFDAHGRVLSETDAAGNRSFYFYNSLGKQIAFVDALNVLHTSTFDAAGNVLVEKTYGIPLVSAPSVGGGVPTPASDSDIRTMNYVRDMSGRVVETRTDKVVMYTVDDLFYERDIKTQQVYDYRGNIIEYADGEGNRTYYFYDRAGNAVLEIDGEGYAIAREYARGDGLVTAETRFSAKPESARLSELIAARDLPALMTAYLDLARGENRVLIYQYDRLGRLTRQTLRDVVFHQVDAATGQLSAVTGRIPVPGMDGFYLTDFAPDISTLYERDGVGNVTRVTAADGTSQTTEYDALNRASKTQGASFIDYRGDSVQETTEYFYTAHGQVAQAIRHGSGGADIVTRASYDRYGQLKETWDPQYGARLRNYYDISGNLVRSLEQVYQRDGTFREDVSTSRFDALNRLVLTQDPAGVKYAMVYNAYGDVARRGKYTGMEAAYQEFFIYDAAGRLQFTNAEDGVLKMRFYDDNGNLTLEIKSGQQSLGDFVKIPELPTPKEPDAKTPSDPKDPRDSVRPPAFDPPGKDDILPPSVRPGDGILSGSIKIPELIKPKLPDVKSPFEIKDPKDPVIPRAIDPKGSLDADIDPLDKADIVPIAVPEDLLKDFLPFNFLDIDYRVRNDVVLGLSPGDVEFTVYHYDNDYRLEGIFAQPKRFGDIVPSSVAPEERGLYYLKKLRDYHETLASTGSRPADDYIIYRSQAYNAFGEITSQTDARGNTTDLVYDKLGNVIERIDPEVTVNVYNNGEPTEATGDRRPVSQFYYDSMGRRIAVRDARGNMLETVSIENGKVSKRFQGDGLASRFGYASYRYDAFGNLRQEVATVNLSGEMLTTDYTYDSNGNRTSVAKTLTRTAPHIFSEATLDESAAVAHVDGSSLIGFLSPLDTVRESYLYDNHGNRIVHHDGLGRRESYVYDQNNRVIEHRAVDGTTTGYRYLTGHLGGLTKVEERSSGEVTIDRSDYFGRVVQHTSMACETFNYIYNAAGWLTEYQHQLSGSVDSLRVYKYFDNGWQSEVTGGGTEERYDYDLNGNRTYEFMSTYGFDRDPDPYYFYREGETFQESRVTYDALNRITDIEDPFYRLHYEYDEMGNRTRVDSRFRVATVKTPVSNPADWGDEDGRTQFYNYDELNRLSKEYRVAYSTGNIDFGFKTDVLLDGPLDGEIPIFGRRTDPGYFVYQSRQYYYDHFDRRSTAIESGLRYDDGNILTASEIIHGSTIDRYTYNVLGLIEAVKTESSENSDAYGFEQDTTLQFRDYDAAGRLTYKVERKQRFFEGDLYNLGLNKTLYAYDSHDNVTREHEFYRYGGGSERERGVQSFYDYRQLLQYTQAYGDHDTRVDYTYKAFDSYQIEELRQTSGGSSGRGIYTYDVLGRVERYWDDVTRRETQYINRLDGKTQARLSGSDRMHFGYLAGNNIGHIGTWKGTTDFGFTQPREASSTPSAVQSYEVRAGDTLQSIAASVYGDSSLWYVIADANGFAGDETLVAGTRLDIPSSISSHNNADNFRPYDSQLALGNNSIGLRSPPPTCEQQAFPIIAAIIAIVVAIVVAVVSYGTLSGVSVGIGLLGSAALGAAAGAVTSVATQGLAIAVGLQREFDWAALATSTLTGALAGLGSYGLGQLQQVAAVAQAMNGASGFVLNAVKGAVVAATEQATSAFIYETFDSAIDSRGFNFDNVTNQFDWRAVALGAIQGAGQSLLGPLNTRPGGASATSLEPGDFERSILNGIGTAAIGEAARAAIYGDGFNPTQFLLNSIGNTVTDYLAKAGQVEEQRQQRERHEREVAASREATADQLRTLSDARAAQAHAEDFDTFLRDTLDPMFAAEREELMWQDLDAALGISGATGDYAIVEGSTWDTLRGRSSDTRALLQATRYANGDDIGVGSFIFIPDESNFTTEEWGSLRREGADYVRARERHREEVARNRAETRDIALQQQYSDRLHQLEESLHQSATDGSLQAYFDSRMSNPDLGAVWSEYEALSAGRSWAGAPRTDDTFPLMVFDIRAREELRDEMTRRLSMPATYHGAARPVRAGNPTAIEETRNAIISLGGDSEAGRTLMGVVAGAYSVIAEPVGWVVDLGQVGYHAVVDPMDYNPHGRNARFASDLAAYIVHEMGAGNRSAEDVSGQLLLDMAIDIPTLGLRHVPDQLETIFNPNTDAGARGVALFNFGFTVFGAVEGVRVMPRMASAGMSRLGLTTGTARLEMALAAEGSSIAAEMAFVEGAGGSGGYRPPVGSGGTGGGGPHGPSPDLGGTEFLTPEHLRSSRRWYESTPRGAEERLRLDHLEQFSLDPVQRPPSRAVERWNLDEVMTRVEADVRAAGYGDLGPIEALPDPVHSPIFQSGATERLMNVFSETAAGPGEIRPNTVERVLGGITRADEAAGGRITTYGTKFAEIAVEALGSGTVGVDTLIQLGVEGAIDAGTALRRALIRQRTPSAPTPVPSRLPVSVDMPDTVFLTPEHLRWFLKRG